MPLLTSLTNVRDWLGLNDLEQPTTRDNLKILRLIAAKSAEFIKLTGRDVIRRSYVETWDGTDSRIRQRAELSPWFPGGFTSGGGGAIGSSGYALNLRQHPVIQITSLVVDGVTVPAGSLPNQAAQVDGWALKDKRRLEMIGQGYAFTPGIQNIVISYDAGHVEHSEAATVPLLSPYVVTPAQMYVGNISVTYANGTPLAAVAGTPTVGQYNVSKAGLYTFAAGDRGADVLLTYAAVPGDVEQAVIDMVAWTYSGKDRIGEKGKTVGDGQGITYADDEIPPSAQAVIDIWRGVNV